jgi:hypothetical protein
MLVNHLRVPNGSCDDVENTEAASLISDLAMSVLEEHFEGDGDSAKLSKLGRCM